MNLEQSAMEEILKFGEFSSLLNKSRSTNSRDKDENFLSTDNERKVTDQEEDAAEQRDEDTEKDTETDVDIDKDRNNYGSQVEND